MMNEPARRLQLTELDKHTLGVRSYLDWLSMTPEQYDALNSALHLDNYTIISMSTPQQKVELLKQFDNDIDLPKLADQVGLSSLVMTFGYDMLDKYAPHFMYLLWDTNKLDDTIWLWGNYLCRLVFEPQGTSGRLSNLSDDDLKKTLLLLSKVFDDDKLMVMTDNDERFMRVYKQPKERGKVNMCDNEEFVVMPKAFESEVAVNLIDGDLFNLLTDEQVKKLVGYANRKVAGVTKPLFKVSDPSDREFTEAEYYRIEQLLGLGALVNSRDPFEYLVIHDTNEHTDASGEEYVKLLNENRLALKQVLTFNLNDLKALVKVFKVSDLDLVDILQEFMVHANQVGEIRVNKEFEYNGNSIPVFTLNEHLRWERSDEDYEDDIEYNNADGFNDLVKDFSDLAFDSDEQDGDDEDMVDDNLNWTMDEDEDEDVEEVEQTVAEEVMAMPANVNFVDFNLLLDAVNDPLKQRMLLRAEEYAHRHSRGTSYFMIDNAPEVTDTRSLQLAFPVGSQPWKALKLVIDIFGLSGLFSIIEPSQVRALQLDDYVKVSLDDMVGLDADYTAVIKRNRVAKVDNLLRVINTDNRATYYKVYNLEIPTMDISESDFKELYFEAYTDVHVFNLEQVDDNVYRWEDTGVTELRPFDVWDKFDNLPADVKDVESILVPDEDDVSGASNLDADEVLDKVLELFKAFGEHVDIKNTDDLKGKVKGVSDPVIKKAKEMQDSELGQAVAGKVKDTMHSAKDKARELYDQLGDNAKGGRSVMGPHMRGARKPMDTPAKSPKRINISIDADKELTPNEALDALRKLTNKLEQDLKDKD